MDKKPKILVTIPNYNHAQYLKESITSIQNQTYDNLDICVGDDGSKNPVEVKDILSDLDSDKRVRSIFQKNYGKWHALNEAIRTTPATLCTSHDADDVSLIDRIDLQFRSMIHTKSLHNLCGFFHCWSEEEVSLKKDLRLSGEMKIINSKEISSMVDQGFKHTGINHYFTGQFETAGVSALFYKEIWDRGVRFNPPNKGIRVLFSEDSDFNFRVTQAYASTTVLAEKLYLYRRNTSTNQEQQ